MTPNHTHQALVEPPAAGTPEATNDNQALANANPKARDAAGASGKSFRLLDLPPELRMMIYEIIVADLQTTPGAYSPSTHISYQTGSAEQPIDALNCPRSGVYGQQVDRYLYSEWPVNDPVPAAYYGIRAILGCPLRATTSGIRCDFMDFLWSNTHFFWSPSQRAMHDREDFFDYDWPVERTALIEGGRMRILHVEFAWARDHELEASFTAWEPEQVVYLASSLSRIGFHGNMTITSQIVRPEQVERVLRIALAEHRAGMSQERIRHSIVQDEELVEGIKNFWKQVPQASPESPDTSSVDSPFLTGTTTHWNFRSPRLANSACRKCKAESAIEVTAVSVADNQEGN